VLHILLAEDNPGDILLVEQALEEHRIPYELHVVHDGGESLNFLVDGPQVLREFRKHPACAHTPVIVVSSSDAQRNRTQMAELGITRYFKKPLDLDAFIREVVEAKGA
jgi:chemotaxis family two-component system response regulator Rcp1